MTVRSEVAGVAHVSLAVGANPDANVEFTVPFRVATRLILRRAMRDRRLVPRLVLDDGTVAIGGSRYLSTDRAVDDVVEGPGTIVGKFGTATLSVPYAVDPPCPR